MPFSYEKPVIWRNFHNQAFGPQPDNTKDVHDDQKEGQATDGGGDGASDY